MEESKEDKRFIVELVKVRKVRSKGLLGTIIVDGYKGNVFDVVRRTLSDADCEECMKNWSWMNLEVVDGEYYYDKHVICSDHMYHILKSTFLVTEKERKENQRLK